MSDQALIPRDQGRSGTGDRTGCRRGGGGSPHPERDEVVEPGDEHERLGGVHHAVVGDGRKPLKAVPLAAERLLLLRAERSGQQRSAEVNTGQQGSVWVSRSR